MASRFRVSSPITEKTSATMKARLVDDKGEGVSLALLGHLMLTHYDAITGNVINGRDGVDALSSVDVVVDDFGCITWSMGAEDNVILNNFRRAEKHITLFEWGYSGGKIGRMEVETVVVNLEKVS